MPLRLNQDGSFPMDRDDNNRPTIRTGFLVELASEMGYTSGSHPDLAAHDALGLATDAALASHEADTTSVHGIASTAALSLTGHPHAQSDVTTLTADLSGKAATGHNHDATYATVGHSHPGGAEAFPVGALYLSVTATNPATSLGYGTWSRVAQGLLLIGQTGAQTGGQQVGSATHAHTFSQPSDHGALTHSGTAVVDHTVTQPNSHSAHAALGTHAHELPFSKATGGTGALKMLAQSIFGSGTSRAPESISAAPTANTVAATVALSQAVAAGTPDAHSAHAGTAVSVHGVTQPTSHATQSHAGGAVATGTTDPPSFVAYVWQRTA